jgi:hypothetical protein
MLQATSAETVILIVVVSVYFIVVIVQIPVPRVICIVLCRRPEVAVVAQIVEITICVPVATRKGITL